jgi:hypothetical protein
VIVNPRRRHVCCNLLYIGFILVFASSIHNKQQFQICCVDSNCFIQGWVSIHSVGLGSVRSESRSRVANEHRFSNTLSSRKIKRKRTGVLFLFSTKRTSESSYCLSHIYSSVVKTLIPRSIHKYTQTRITKQVLV